MNTAAAPTTSGRLFRYPRLLAVAGACALLLLVSLSTCSPKRSALQEAQALGMLKVVTVNSPTTYYMGPGGEATGFDYDLVKGLADRLGLGLDLIVVDNPQAALLLIAQNRAHLAAAGITVTPSRSRLVRFGQPLRQVVPLLVYRRGESRPRDLSDLQGLLRVVRGSSHAERLRELRTQLYPQLRWDETGDEGFEELLYDVANGNLDYTVGNSDLVAINQRYYPNLRVSFSLSEAQNVAWAFPPGSDTSLYEAAEQYLQDVGRTELARIKDRHFGHVHQVDSQGALTLATHVQSRLPRYRAAFERAGEKYGLDWRLLAAIGYQESHWDPAATSPTGVRGIMQLTLDTAALLGVANREDPAQSIDGGARYFLQMRNQLPPEIQEPDRTWMALAGYNMGIGHLYDARKLTQKLGGNPNHWVDVRRHLPLLTQARYYSQAKHGYARSLQALTYVGNVRTYYDMLVWLHGGPPPSPEAPDAPLQPEEDPDRKRDPLRIDSPVL
ncbi:MAG TPA: membrane-bound lytic murein transglycosylase MltF [Solimonas sp.]|nr:membrane-bound lytic murein transglycosylase MltF [Solimonas sp.]